MLASHYHKYTAAIQEKDENSLSIMVIINLKVVKCIKMMIGTHCPTFFQLKKQDVISRCCENLMRSSLLAKYHTSKKQIYTISQKVTTMLGKFAPLRHLTRVITKVFVGMYIKKYDLSSQTDYIFFFRIQKRQSMDRRQFEAAHLKYACLRVVSLYQKFLSLDAICFDGDTNTAIEVITPLLFCGFEAKYAGLTLYFEHHFCLPT